ncbi:chorismate--pyruvate lyase [Psychromonas sp. B3M02]|uniref:chorismate--pyruvate lyase family protein n=1 Tax=Psychromonas sp. B3M02 TaxID=2267226 RepID=UPI000DE94053|nr:chorismate lyase [Psychromonas sp. B3M02]RBW45102.1 chorismate--pyruvate lyase [Psychromonas sp. B3M02]
MLNQLLNIASSASWQEASYVPDCSEPILAWLLDESSLTKKLEQHCRHFHVEVRQQVTTSTEQTPLSTYFTDAQQVLVREVFLHCDHTAHVFAQTEIPEQTLSDEQQNLAEIGSESLGRLLFQNSSLVRGKIEIAEFKPGSLIHQLCQTLSQHCEHSLWARRSLFYIENKPLLVSEVFLPASDIYQ